jgi:2-acylglycerol O-acyltransferase 2
MSIQRRLKKLIGFPVFEALEMFFYIFNLLTNRMPIFTVIGRPIDIKKVDSPTNDQIKDVKNIYIGELIKLFNEHKCNYLINENIELEII